MKKLISGAMALALLATALMPSAALAQHRGPPPRPPRVKMAICVHLRHLRLFSKQRPKSRATQAAPKMAA